MDKSSFDQISVPAGLERVGDLDFILRKLSPLPNRINRGLLTGQLRRLYDGTTGPYHSPDEWECHALFELAKFACGNVLEVGTWKGRSSCFLAEGIKQSGLSEKRELYCLDWFQGDLTGGENASEQDARAALTRFHPEGGWQIVVEDMTVCDFSVFAPIGLVFYDSDHREEPTFLVLLRLHSQLEPNALVAVHDANFKSSRRALHRLITVGLYRLVAHYDVWEGFVVLVRRD